jgi:ketosteroid isomerase-like protein
MRAWSTSRCRPSSATSASPSWRLDGELPISGTWNGRDEILGGFFATARTFLDPASTRIEVTRSLADGDHVAVEWTSRARTRDGAPYENHCAGVFTVRDGKIRAVREYMDTHYAHKQALNAMDAPAPAAEVQPCAPSGQPPTF